MECKGCEKGISMCHYRPCLGTPEEFEKIIQAGFAEKLRIDFWIGRTPGVTEEDMKKVSNMLGIPYIPNPFDYNVEFLTGGTDTDKDYMASFIPTGKCNLLTEDNLCSLHDLSLKPSQGALSCCKNEDNEAESNLYYVKLWDTPKGKEVLELFKKTVKIS